MTQHPVTTQRPVTTRRPTTGMSRGLSVAQRSRRQRMLHAAVELASAGGYEAVGMREVADRAEVALGTLYRHFPSKDHLLLGVMAEALDRLHARMRRSRPPGASAADRVADVLARSTRSLLRTPRLSAAILRAWVVIPGDVGGDAERISAITRDTIWWATGADGSPTEHDLRIIKILGRVWFGELLFWANGRESDHALLDTVDTAVRMLYASGPPPAAPR